MTREGGGLALGGRHNYYIHNNQINDGVGGGGCVGEEMGTDVTRGGGFQLSVRPSN
jgi:hypothetical protein